MIDRIFSNKFVIVAQIIIYRLLLDNFYVNRIIGKYNYFMICPENRNFITIVFSWVLLSLGIYTLIKQLKINKFSSQVIILLILLSFVPTTTLLSFSADYGEFYILMFIYWSLLFIVSNSTYSLKLPVLRFKNTILFYSIICIYVLAILYVSFTYTGFRFHFSLKDVYDLRFESREFNMPIIFNYILASSGAIMSISLVYFLSIKKYLFSALIFIVILLNFGIGGHKSVIMMMMVSIISYYFYSFKKAKYLIPFFIILVVACLFFNEIGSLIGFRVLFVPSNIHYAYYEYFNIRELDYWREGVLARFGFETPYLHGINYLIGEYMTGNIEISANNGLFSDAYYNFGYFGIMLFPIMIVLFFKYIDKVVQGIDERLLFVVILSFTMALISATFTTCLLTGGFLIIIIFLYSLLKQ